MAQAVFRAAKKGDAGPVIFEIARSEIGYTRQRPLEYACAVLAAAIKTGWRGPVFLQGDHFQINAKKFAAEGERETQAVRDLIREAILASFYNIDIDTSTLVDLSHPTIKDQQRMNFTLAAELTALIRIGAGRRQYRWGDRRGWKRTALWRAAGLHGWLSEELERRGPLSKGQQDQRPDRDHP